MSTYLASNAPARLHRALTLISRLTAAGMVYSRAMYYVAATYGIGADEIQHWTLAATPATTLPGSTR